MARHRSDSSRQPVRAAFTGALCSASVLLLSAALFYPTTAPDAQPIPAAQPPLTTSVAIPTAPKLPVVTSAVPTTSATPIPSPTPTTSRAAQRMTSSEATTTPPVVEAAEPEPSRGSDPRCNDGRVRQIVRDGCNDITAAVNVPGSIGGFGLRPTNPTSCHPLGLGLDLGLGQVTSQGSARNRQGDAIAAYARANADRLGITLVLWEAPNHWDHVHLSFAPCMG